MTNRNQVIRPGEVTAGEKAAEDIFHPKPAPSANSIQHGGDHYRSKPIQPWDYIASNGLGFFEGNIVKYVTRWPERGGLVDLKKAQHYIEKLIEIETAKESGQ